VFFILNFFIFLKICIEFLFRFESSLLFSIKLMHFIFILMRYFNFLMLQFILKILILSYSLLIIFSSNLIAVSDM